MLKVFNIVTYLLFIFFLAFSHLKLSFFNIHLGNIFIPSDKINHFLAFVIFVFIYYYSTQSFWQVLVVGIFVGIFIEFIQYFLPYRDCDIFDLLTDVCGIIFGMILLIVFFKRRENDYN